MLAGSSECIGVEVHFIIYGMQRITRSPIENSLISRYAKWPLSQQIKICSEIFPFFSK